MILRNRDCTGYMADMIETAEHPRQWWFETVAPRMTRPPKNKLVGFTRVPASTLLPELAANYRAQRNHDTGSSSQAADGFVMPDPVF